MRRPSSRGWKLMGMALMVPWVAAEAGALGGAGQEAVRDRRGWPHALSGDRPVRTIQYGLEHGLITLDLNSLALGPDGRLWVGSASGILTFDGTSFRAHGDPIVGRPVAGERALDSSSQAPPSLAYAVTSVVDGEGRVWVGTEEGHIFRHTGSSFEVMDDLGACRGHPGLSVTRDGTVFGSGEGLVRFGASGPELILNPADFTDLMVSAVYETPPARGAEGAGPLWICTNKGLFGWSAHEGLSKLDSEPLAAAFFDLGGRQWRIRAGDAEPGFDGTTHVVSCVHWGVLALIPLDQNRTLVVLGGASYVADFNGGDPRLVPFEEQGEITSALAAGDGAFWVAVAGNGLRYLEPLPFETVDFEGKQDALWIVIRPRDESHALIGAWDSPSVWELSARPGVTAAMGLRRLDWLFDRGDRPDENVAFDFNFDGSGAGYCLSSVGLAALERDQGGLRGPTPEWIDEVPADTGRMARDPDTGHVWLRRNDFIEEFAGTRPTGRRFELERKVVCQLAVHRGRVFAFHRSSVSEFDTATMGTRVLLPLPAETYGSLFVQATGDLWVSTDGLGLYRVSVAGAVDHWTAKHGLPTQFLGWVGTVPGPTEKTHLWANTNAGAMAISFDSLERTASGEAAWLDCRLFGSGESLGGDGAPLANGMLVLPTFDGPIVIDTHAPLPSHEPPRLSIGTVRAGGVPMGQEERLVGDTAMEFEYDAVQLPSRLGSEVQYRLQGHDEVWIPGGNDRLARYGSLGPGEYRFQLRARSAGSAFGPVLTGPTIEITPHWYERRTVLGAMLLGLVSLFAGIFRLRTRRLVEHSRELNGFLERLSVSEERYRLLFRTAPTAIIMCTADGGVLEWNDAAARLFLPTSEPRGEPLCSLADLLAHPSNRPQMMAHIEEASVNGATAPFRQEIRSCDGATRPCLWQLATIPGQSDASRSLIALVVDKADEERAAHDLLELRRQLARAEERERSRIARELHDDLSQRLAALSMNLRGAKDAAANHLDSDLLATLTDSCDGIEALSRGVHSLSRRLHPAVLDDLGLSAALRSECYRREGLMDATISLTDDGGSKGLRGEVGLALFRVAQEALQNAAKHSSADDVKVRLQRNGEEILLEVEDGGVGFDTTGASSGGLGLSSMRERMSLIGGELTIRSGAGVGTLVRATAKLSTP